MFVWSTRELWRDATHFFPQFKGIWCSRFTMMMTFAYSLNRLMLSIALYTSNNSVAMSWETFPTFSKNFESSWVNVRSFSIEVDVEFSFMLGLNRLMSTGKIFLFVLRQMCRMGDSDARIFCLDSASIVLLENIRSRSVRCCAIEIFFISCSMKFSLTRCSLLLFHSTTFPLFCWEWQTSSDSLGDTVLFLEEFDREAAEMCNRWATRDMNWEFES